MKITNKMLNGYYHAESELLGIGFNDNYNKVKYGLTMAESQAIRKVLVSLTGSGKTRLPLSDIKRELQSI